MIDGPLRGGHLDTLKVYDVCAAGRIKERALVTQSKAGKSDRLEITEANRNVLKKRIADPDVIGSEFLWRSQLQVSPQP